MPSRTFLFQLIAFSTLCLLILFSYTQHVAVVVKPKTKDHSIFVVTSGDRSQWEAMATCINSVLLHAAHRARLVFYVLALPEEHNELEMYLQSLHLPVLQFLNAIRVTSFHRFDIKMPIATSMRDNPARKLSTAHNFVRFYLSDLLPNDVSKVIWLDCDVLVLGDVEEIFDHYLNDDEVDARESAVSLDFKVKETTVLGVEESSAFKKRSKYRMRDPALAVVVRRRPFKASIIRRLADGLAGKPFGVHAKLPASVNSSASNERRPRHLNMTHGSEIAHLLPRTTNCIGNHSKGACFHFNAGVMLIRLDRWRKRNTTAHLEQWVRFLADNSKLALGLTQPPLQLEFFEDAQALPLQWNVGSASDLAEMDEEDMLKAKALHFNGDEKPWLEDAAEHVKRIWRQFTPQ